MNPSSDIAECPPRIPIVDDHWLDRGLRMKGDADLKTIPVVVNDRVASKNETWAAAVKFQR
jgi:hypothetical protein